MIRIGPARVGLYAHHDFQFSHHFRRAHTISLIMDDMK
jgi:hypothetical protein